ncbi:phosphatase PAP2 family protein [Rhodoferax sp.]|uniref:phosphatase PAP2 family protein n=1 Tax=Rhodoferax sp. TaxID=50421 RepID=UPI0019E13621|nr:phosphatase PAP2 family protein [Rhodoferax sp.]MBE0475294.1 phosphatase PAP2 family protein [Rhodoferax sp.]
MHAPPTSSTLCHRAVPLSPALITGAALIGLLIWDASGLDLAVMQRLANAQGFALRDNWWLAEVLHTRARQLAGMVFIALMVMNWWPAGWFRGLQRWQRIEIVLGILLSLLAVSTLKHFSLTSCPWDLQDFGGKASYVSHWTWGARDGGSGRCFPAGHASSALAFIALALPWLFSDNASLRRRGQWLLLMALFLGLVFGLAQTLRGAHYPSHTLWTSWICWTVAVVNHRVFEALGKQVFVARW